MGRREDLAAQRRRVERNARALSGKIAGWLERRARLELREALAGLHSGKYHLAKAAAGDVDEALVRILARHGVRQVKAAGDFATGYGGEWRVPPELVDEIIGSKDIKVTRLSRNIRERVLETIRRIIREANREDPRPSVGDLARRFRSAFEPGSGEQIWALDPSRASLIARTEAQQNESTGIFAGMADVGVAYKEWIASGNPNHGDRRHDLMDGQQRRIDEPFVNPTTGEELMYPGDPAAAISETANCGCGFRALRGADFGKRSLIEPLPAILVVVDNVYDHIALIVD